MREPTKMEKRCVVDLVNEHFIDEHEALKYARTVLRCVRSPTREMIGSGNYPGLNLADEDLVMAYELMIDAASPK